MINKAFTFGSEGVDMALTYAVKALTKSQLTHPTMHLFAVRWIWIQTLISYTLRNQLAELDSHCGDC